jgi:putative CocE/NonD family hydrolase
MYTKILQEEVMSTMLPKDFPADKLSQPQYKVKVEKDVFVKMRDGVQVAVDIFRPDAPGEFPALYATSAYQKDLYHLPPWPIFHMRETNKIEWFVLRRYVYVHHDIRGSGKSVEGQWQLFSQEEQNDFYDVIEWTAEQPWCDGKVGMIGESLYAWVQWFAAAMQPPHLACIAPFDAGADMYRDVCYHGGIMALGFPTAWHMTEIRAHYRLGQKGEDPNVGNWDMGWHIINHPTFDDFWKIRRPDFTKIKCPIYSIGILHKVGIHMRGNVRGYEEADVPKKLLLCHGDFEGDEMAIFESKEMRLLHLRWYDHWLKGNDTGMMEEAPVTIFVRGKEVYREENEWPLARTQYTPFYLHAGPSGGVDSLNDGRLSWDPPKTNESSFTLSYPDPDWSHFSGVGTAIVIDGIPHPTKKILTFTSDPLEEDLEIIGSIVLVLHASSDQTDQDIMVRLVDQAPDTAQVPGMPPKARILTRGWLKASHREKDEALSKPYRPYYKHENPTPIEPGKLYRYEIEIWSTSNCFLKGHRIRLDLANYDSNAFDFGGHYYGLKVGKDTFYHDKDHPSRLILPVIPK